VWPGTALVTARTVGQRTAIRFDRLRWESGTKLGGYRFEFGGRDATVLRRFGFVVSPKDRSRFASRRGPIHVISAWADCRDPPYGADVVTVDGRLITVPAPRLLIDSAYRFFGAQSPIKGDDCAG